MTSQPANQFDQRIRVISVVRSYLRTPYHHCGNVKGVGVDCLTLLAGVYTEANIVPSIAIPPYSPQWHLNHSAELYLQGLLQYTHEIAKPQPGDIALWKFGRCFSHGAIITDWPNIIHAYMGRCVTEENAEAAQWLKYIGESKENGKPRPVRFFSPWSEP